MKKILNLAGGKIGPLPSVLDPDKNFIVNVDMMYQNPISISGVEQEWKVFVGGIHAFKSVSVNDSVYPFMEKCILQFDVITIYRFLEHVPAKDVLYFIYLLSTSMPVGGLVDIIVPNYQLLARMLLSEDVNSLDFEKMNILLTTEMLNEPCSPHTSIWTPERARKFFELEGRFKITHIDSQFEFDGRDIYLRFQANKVK